MGMGLGEESGPESGAGGGGGALRRWAEGVSHQRRASAVRTTQVPQLLPPPPPVCLPLHPRRSCGPPPSRSPGPSTSFGPSPPPGSAPMCYPPPPPQTPSPVPWTCGPAHAGACPSDASEGKGRQRRPQERLGRRLEEVAEAVAGGYCRLRTPCWPALDVSRDPLTPPPIRRGTGRGAQGAV